MIRANYESDAGKRKQLPPEEYGTIPHMPFEEYSERLKHCLMMKRENGILEARLHTNGDSMQWGAPAHQGLHYFFDWAGRDPDNEVHQYFQPISCLHCLDAPCIRACPRSAISKDIETGITLVHEDECIGCKSCLSVCPYGAPQFYDGRLMLCDLCIHRLGEGRYTACEAACPARAIHVGTTDEISAMVGKKAAERAGKEEQELR